MGARLQLVAFALMLLAGCVSSGTQVKNAAFTQFQTGVTTESDVAKALGPPIATKTTSEGLRVILYVGTHAQASFIPIAGPFTGGASGQATAVTFRFGPDHKLLGYSSAQSNVALNTGIAGGGAASATATRELPLAALPAWTATAQAPSSPTSHHAHTQAVGATFGPDLYGLRVVSVEKYGPAARAGLRAGDIITHIDGKETAPIYWEYAAQNITNAEGPVTLRIAGRGDRTLLLSTGGARTEGTTNPVPNDSASPAASQTGATTAASHVRLGVHCMQVTAALAPVYHLPVDIGVRVVTVEAGSVAEAGGIHVGDVLLKYGDRSLNEISDLTAAIAATTKGAGVPITVWRRTGESVVDVQF
jgi:membrane-associated protease RseP (regulator of RpoE activity)